jgi:hypothetical protein
MASDIDVTDRLCDLRHMARNAFVASAVPRVVRVQFYARGVRPVLRIGSMARQAKSITPLTHNSRILRTVRIVATETSNAPRFLPRFPPGHSQGDWSVPSLVHGNAAVQQPCRDAGFDPALLRHAGVSDAIADVIKNLAIRH